MAVACQEYGVPLYRVRGERVTQGVENTLATTPSWKLLYI